MHVARCLLPRHAMVAWSMLSHTQCVSCCAVAFVACCASLHVAARASCCNWIVAVPRRRSISSSRSARSCVRTNVTPLLVTDHNMRQRCAVRCAPSCAPSAACRTRSVARALSHRRTSTPMRRNARVHRRPRPSARVAAATSPRAPPPAPSSQPCVPERVRPLAPSSLCSLRDHTRLRCGGYSAMGHSYSVPQ